MLPIRAYSLKRHVVQAGKPEKKAENDPEPAIVAGPEEADAEEAEVEVEQEESPEIEISAA